MPGCQTRKSPTDILLDDIKRKNLEKRLDGKIAEVNEQVRGNVTELTPRK